MSPAPWVLPRRVVISSESPSLRFAFQDGEYLEILSHEPSDIGVAHLRDARLPLVYEGELVGSVSAIAIEGVGGHLGGVPEFSAVGRGPYCRALHEKSIGLFFASYQIMEMTFTGTRPWRGRACPAYRCRWRPIHVGFFPEPCGPRATSAGWNLIPRADG